MLCNSVTSLCFFNGSCNLKKNWSHKFLSCLAEFLQSFAYAKLPSTRALLSNKILRKFSTDLILSCKNFSKILPAQLELVGISMFSFSWIRQCLSQEQNKDPWAKLFHCTCKEIFLRSKEKSGWSEGWYHC